MFIRLRQAGRTIVVATHDLDCLMECFDQVIALKNRVVAEGTPREVLTSDILYSTLCPAFSLHSGHW